MIVRVVDIGWIYDHHWLNFLFFIYIYIRILTNWDPKFLTAQKSIARSPLEYVTFDADGRNSGSKYGKAQFT